MPFLFRKQHALIVTSFILAITCLGWSGRQSQNSSDQMNKRDTIPAKKLEESKVEREQNEFRDDHEYFPESFIDIDCDELAERIESSVNEALDRCDVDVDELIDRSEFNMDELMDDLDEQLNDIDIENNIEESSEFVQQAQKELDFNNRQEPNRGTLEIKIDLKNLKKEIEHASKELESTNKEIRRELKKMQKEINQAGLTSI